MTCNLFIQLLRTPHKFQLFIHLHSLICDVLNKDIKSIVLHTMYIEGRGEEKEGGRNKERVGTRGRAQGKWGGDKESGGWGDKESGGGQGKGEARTREG